MKKICQKYPAIWTYLIVYAKGFIEGCGGALTDLSRAVETLPLGAILMTFENGIRFLTDYLEGDHYFKIHREGHNLDRCRTQLNTGKRYAGKTSTDERDHKEIQIIH